MLDDLYREQILDRYKHPRFRGPLDDPDARYEDENPLCGDRVVVYLKFDADGKAQARFEGEGCAISMAAADLLMEYATGQTADALRGLTKDDVLDLIGLRLSPARLKCALLPYKALKAALYGLEADPGADASATEGAAA